MSAERIRPGAGVMNTVFKSGPLFISSKGIGWKSWKRRWFILTRTSLVFFKNDPSALPQRGGEVNLTLGGIDLNSSGSVVVREDKKLLTVLFPDGRDGRAFTLKAESSEDLYEWKTALEHALAQAPSAALVMGHNGIFRNDTTDTIEGSFQQWRDKRPVKSMVVGRPILLALEDIDGGPSFLEKALRFLEVFGVKVEGILRQSADVEDVYRRVQEYEQGRNEFSSDEDAHVVGDCVKHVLRELPSSPVPASCCIALLEASRIERKETRLNALRSAVFETFPEPNRRLLQRILKMMHIIAAHSSDNRMTPSAVAACMAPLLLRPLLAGECELEDDFDMSDSSAQLLAAANAANNAQAIITTLLEDYDNIFDDDNLQRCSFSADSQMGHSESDESSDDENLDMKDSAYHDTENEDPPEVYDDPDRVLSGKFSGSSGYAGNDLYSYKAFEGDGGSDVESTGETSGLSSHKAHRDSNFQFNEKDICKKESESPTEMHSPIDLPASGSHQSMADLLSSKESGLSLPIAGPHLSAEKSSSKLSGYGLNVKRPSFWGRNNTRKNTTVESVDSSGEEELAIQRLEVTKNELRTRIEKEAKGNQILQASLERRKQALHERRLALEQDVSRLQEQLQAERDLRADLEIGLNMSSGQFSNQRGMNSKTRAELEEIALAEADVARLKQKVTELHLQLNQQSQNHYGALSDASDRYQHLQNLHSQQKYLQQNFDMTLAFCNHETKQRNEDRSLGTERKNNVKDQAMSSTSNAKQLFQKLYGDTISLSDSKSTEASTSFSADDLSAIDSSAVASTSRSMEAMEYTRNPSVASSTLVELTSRLDFFKERRNQLMEQLHNLDASYATATSQGLVYKQPSSPPWK
ncbi:rho GTPase-activating protein 7-like isoform X1 [Papaver somniferum]|uniref:rho GTPase-activating protein 7-like isoform X1 n=1 Tax=Papaver somniferum TaxID=3469 RepID=UPI000E702D89|nr:rho GTPase-activating protein 7-like isoform X1 [Papaver somniferum]